MGSSAQAVMDKQGQWDLSDLYSSPDDPKIEQTWKEISKRTDQYVQTYRGKINHPDLSAEVLARGIQELEEISVLLSKPISFAELRYAADTSDPKNGAFAQAQMERASEIRVKLVFFELELQKVPDQIINPLLSNPVLGNYLHFIKNVRIYTPHSLSEAEEIILEETANTGSRAWVRLFEEILSNHVFKLKRPGSNEIEECSQEEVLNLIRDTDRNVRQAAADAFSKGLLELQRVIVFTYNNLLQDKNVSDRLRKHPYPEHSRHLANELDKETVNLVMSVCKEKGSIVSKYYDIKREILGLSELTHIDRYAPLKETKERLSFDKAKDIVLNSFGQCSQVMKDRANEFFEKNWIDYAPRQGKRGGAFCSYLTPDTHPVVLMSYLDEMRDVATLAHELGHGVHASLSREQSYFNFHGTLPLAELASTFGEMLVFENLVKEASPEDQLSLLAHKIEDSFATVFRQAALFRFEQRCHQTRRSQGELTPEQFAEIWQDEQQSMFGASVKLGKQHEDWWSYIGHFFFAPFYVYAYSFGELLALSIYRKYQQEGPSFEKKYIEVLRLGGSRSPHELMSLLGIDLNSKEFWLNGLGVIESLVDRFEKLWNELRK